MKAIGILYCSAGNESVGDMWKETKIFDMTEPIENILKWASKGYGIENFEGHLEITIAQEGVI